MRDAGVEALLYASARDPRLGVNLGLISPRAFAVKDVPSSSQQTWGVTVTAEGALFARGIGTGLRKLHYAREEYMVSGRLPAPAC